VAFLLVTNAAAWGILATSTSPLWKLTAPSAGLQVRLKDLCGDNGGLSLSWRCAECSNGWRNVTFDLRDDVLLSFLYSFSLPR
jgi:hypothetical protein